MSDNQETLQAEELQKEEKVEDAAETDTSKFENIIKQQEKQIEQLLKQTELANKVNQQLGVKLDETLKNLNTITPQDPYGWIDKELTENFKYKSSLDFDDPSSIFAPAGEAANWYLRVLKEKNLSNEKIATKMNNIFEIISGKTAPINESI